MVFGKGKKKEKFKEVEQPEQPEIEENPMQEIAEETRTKTKEKTRIVVVKDESEFPRTRYAKTSDGISLTYMTWSEALSEAMNEREEE